MTSRVLIVDDSLTVRMDLSEAFEEAGFEVRLCATVEEASAICTRTDLDLAIVDLLLPDGDGTEILSRIKENPATAHVPVILLSSESEVRDRIKGLERGADEYVGKPYEANHLVRRARVLLGEGAPVPRRQTILVIEDSLTFCQALREELETHGYRAIVATTAEEGLRRAAEVVPDALVVDGVLPGMDGAALVRRTRLDPALQDVPCLFLTASESGADEVAALEAGADAFVRKEQGTAVVPQRLRRLLRAAAAHRAKTVRATGGARRLLLVNPSQAMEQWLQPILRSEGHDVIRARSEKEALQLLSLQAPDCILLEESEKPDATADLCRRLRNLPLLVRTPIVVLATREGAEAGAHAIAAGADDWIFSGAATSDLVRARIRALVRRHDIDEREQSVQDELDRRARELERANEQLRLYRELIERMPLAAAVAEWEDPADPDAFRYVMANPAMEDGSDREASTLVGRTLRDRHPELVDSDLPRKLAEALESGEARRLPRFRWGENGAGEGLTWDVLVVPLGARKVGILAEDITDRVCAEQDRARLEKQMHVTQRLEAIGRLAGGVAHDFNNVLTVVQTYASFLRDRFREADPAREDADAIMDAAKRASRLTHQLLAFGRKQVQQVEIVNLNQTLEDLDRMLRRLIGEDVDLVTRLAPDLGAVRVDVAQIEQVVMNLVVNARDAMPEGGKLTIETSRATLTEDYAQQKGLSVAAGDYVMIAVSDTGTGMDEATRAQIFEPFFTTKEQGKGTGLGLATVYGIVRQSGGFVWVYSEVGRGTTFKIYLPRAEGDRTVEMSPRTGVEPLNGDETVLLVEDEELVRRAASRILRRYGYRVLEASHGGEALVLAEQYEGSIHVMLTDIVMPHMSGNSLAARIAAVKPGLRVVYMSGYADNAVFRHGVLEEGVPYVQKPFSPELLLKTLRTAIGAPGKADES